jgi:predicted dehydrogenase/NADPH:quinone reductase-like Zn-dependent oxidoreductase
MKQVLQYLRSGVTRVHEVPTPVATSGQIAARTRRTLISAGTERMLVEFGKAGWLAKARQQPDKVRLTFEKIKTDGLAPTLESIRNKLDQPLALGYCNVGTVVDVGKGARGFHVGERVVSNGHHAEVVAVPQHLCARVPDGVSDDEAPFAVVGAIGLQGIRLLAPTLGECVVVTGLGLIGLITVQLLRANGCRVLGIDFDEARLQLARRFGAETVDLGTGEDVLSAAARFSRGRGVDGVLLTAATGSSEPVRQAAQMCRRRGRIVLVGVTGLELSRSDFYEKELTFQVSCSYGPGRYDAEYEQHGHDYPLGFVRWTEQRNFEAVLDMMADRRLDVRPLVSHRFPVERAQEAYDLITGTSPSLGVLLDYRLPETGDGVLERTVRLAAERPATASDAAVGFIGAGNYAGQVLIPAFKAAGARLKIVSCRGGVSGSHAAQRYGFEEVTTDTGRVLSDAAVNTVVIATRHDSHARYVLEAVKARKHVFVEKPLALALGDVEAIEAAYAGLDSPPLVMIGFNRRFAPQVLKVRELLATLSEPKAFVMTVNAGAVPPQHWTQDREAGGGRIIGEACHFIDLLRALAGHSIAGYQVTTLRRASGSDRADDRVSVGLTFEDGSIGTVHYLANGHKSFPKERLEVFCGGRVLQLDNFRRLTGFGWPGFRRMNLWRQDKGQRACVAAFVEAIRSGKTSPIPFDEVLEVSRVAIQIGEAARR